MHASRIPEDRSDKYLGEPIPDVVVQRGDVLPPENVRVREIIGNGCALLVGMPGVR